MTTWMFALFLPALAWSFTPTSEMSCTDLDLRTESLGQVRNQGKISWCYAFTASDMLAHAARSGQRYSAADLALNYNESLVGRIMSKVMPNGNPHETGFNKIALEKAMKDGTCPESVFPSEKWMRVAADKSQEVPMPEAMKEIAALHSRRRSLKADSLPFHYQFRHVDRQKFFELLQTKHLRTFYQRLRLTACQGERREYGARWRVKMVLRNQKIFSRINQQLDRGRLVGLDYDARILENKDHTGIKLSELHTSSIVGRRWNRGKNICEYLIRDSRGPQCTRYDASYECQSGNVWLTESQIFSSLISVVYMLSPSGI